MEGESTVRVPCAVRRWMSRTNSTRKGSSTKLLTSLTWPPLQTIAPNQSQPDDHLRGDGVDLLRRKGDFSSRAEKPGMCRDAAVPVVNE